ncbi:hypothetical protein SAMN05444274_107194 [Mariniphaga anaerophila]|uniref:NHL repeat-containing protein n=1 Tax=Mariniphaga anaerophila TaxID=1484053 RepID=A0A1M5DPR8_9BACT|nr:hypothetical protein [Mariniphaga anaerophila]SHF68896.1 hypothetical protein SAMN05444274_107194 [Mariniphaga anaerophila]
MKNKGIIIFLLLLVVVIVAVLVVDFISDRPDRSNPNPFAYNVEEFKNVAPELILYKESKNFRIGFEEPVAVAIQNNKLYIAGDKELKVVDLSGKLLANFPLPEKPLAVEVFQHEIFVAVKNKILMFDETGNALSEWPVPGNNSLITAVAADNNNVFVADAGMRKVIRYSKNGEMLGEFDGKAEEGALHGFIVPSPCFDLDINDQEELWVVNPGLHALENYTYDGQLRTYWKSTGVNLEGFSGCCNPSHFTFLSDGRYVTSEKGLVRIKTYKRSGEFEGVVAAPAKFVDEGRAPDVAADSNDNIYALDFDKKIIRVFEPK